MKQTMDYQKQGTDFLEATKTEMEFKKIGHDFYFDDDKEERDIWRVTLIRRKDPIQKYSFKFGQSIANVNKRPTAYDVLTCLQKYDPGTFENFCGDCGYDTDSRKAEKIYLAVQNEYYQLSRMFSEAELELMQEIQ